MTSRRAARPDADEAPKASARGEREHWVAMVLAHASLDPAGDDYDRGRALQAQALLAQLKAERATTARDTGAQEVDRWIDWLGDQIAWLSTQPRTVELWGRADEARHWHELMVRRAAAADVDRLAATVSMPVAAATGIARHAKAALLHLSAAETTAEAHGVDLYGGTPLARVWRDARDAAEALDGWAINNAGANGVPGRGKPGYPYAGTERWCHRPGGVLPVSPLPEEQA
jgi:hypothetical protein